MRIQTTIKRTLILFLFISTSALYANTLTELDKGPVVIEVMTNHATVKDALTEVKTKLLMEKFIAENGIGESGFTAKRTTGSDSDYYVADVVAEKQGQQIKITITFVKVGTGMKSMKKLGAKIKEALLPKY